MVGPISWSSRPISTSRPGQIVGDLAADRRCHRAASCPSLKAAMFNVSFRWCLGAFWSRSSSRPHAASAYARARSSLSAGTGWYGGFCRRRRRWTWVRRSGRSATPGRKLLRSRSMPGRRHIGRWPLRRGRSRRRRRSRHRRVHRFPCQAGRRNCQSDRRQQRK